MSEEGAWVIGSQLGPGTIHTDLLFLELPSCGKELDLFWISKSVVFYRSPSFCLTNCVQNTSLGKAQE